MVKSLGVEVPPLPPPPNARDRLSSTGGSRGEECQSKSACQLEFLRALNERDRGLEQRFSGIDGRLENIEAHMLELRKELEPFYRTLSNLEAFRAHERGPNRNSTPAQIKGQAEVRTAGGTRVRAPVWSALVISALLVVAAAIWQVEEIAKLFK